jgi:nucleotide-binding universal stress UspA family protein
VHEHSARRDIRLRGPVLAGVHPGQAAAVVHRAAELAFSLDVPLICAYVEVSSYLSDTRPGGVPVPLPIDPDVVDDDGEAVSQELLTQLESVLRGSSVAWSLQTLAGDPVKALGGLAVSAGASLIVVGTRERRFGARLEQLLTGSIAVHLTHRQHTPVLVVPLDPHREAAVGHDRHLRGRPHGSGA